MLNEWIVTLYNREDLDDFYEDMQTPGGNLYIPDRAVDVAKQRPISRNTHYMLTDEEAMLVKSDERVWDVSLAELVRNSFQPLGYKIDEGIFSKNYLSSGPTLAETDINWAFLRQTRNAQIPEWGFNNQEFDPTNDLAKSEINANANNVIITASGRNVDVVIVDTHFPHDHPEFAVNPDGTGGSRVVSYNWLQNDIGFGTGTYDYTLSDQDNHGGHVAGTVAGNTQGWARDANIYHMSPFPNTPNFGVAGYSGDTLWDFVRAWHNSKPINPVTGRKNPTISNHSYTSLTDAGQYGYSPIKAVTYRGTRYAPGRDLTVSELQARGYAATSQTFKFLAYYTSLHADIQDAIDDGIIIVAAAGNESWKIVGPTDQDYDNTYETIYLPTSQPQVGYVHRGSGLQSGQSYAPVIVVGAVDTVIDEYKATFSNCGNLVDVYAVGMGVQSSVYLTTYYAMMFDPRNSQFYFGKTQGTSMASPQVCGMLACLAESWPNMNQAQAHQWIVDFANNDQLSDTGTDDASDFRSLQGAPNKFAKWTNQRPIRGGVFPQRKFRPRTIDGDPTPLVSRGGGAPTRIGRRVYPRPRIRRRG